jgi:hypothetical protein
MPAPVPHHPASSEHYTVFSDESGVHERYLVYGALLIPTQRVESTNALLDKFCGQCGLQGEISWKKCSKREIERYSDFAAQFWAIDPPRDFRAMAIDTRKNPLESSEHGCDNPESGFYKFYYQFLTRSLQIAAPGVQECDVVVGDRSDSYRYRTDILQSTIGGDLKRRLGANAIVRRAQPRLNRVHQLADLLLGSVSYALNRASPSAYKEQLRLRIEQLVGHDLAHGSMPNERPFNLWGFSARGQPRWLPGDQGAV